MSPTNMTAEQIKAAIRKANEITNTRNEAEILAYYDERYTPDVVAHNLAMGTEVKGLDALKKNLDLTAFPDMRYTIEDIIVEGDKAFLRRTWTGTHKGKLTASAGNLPPTGKKVTMTQFFVLRHEGGKIAEIWQLANRLSFYQQLGVTPTPEMK